MLNKINARYRLKRSIITGTTPTFNTQEDFTDGTFLTTDIRPGEFFYNTVDNRLFIANSTGLTELALYATGATAISTTASNGITRTNNNFTLGGSLTGDTTISASDNDFIISGDSVNVQQIKLLNFNSNNPSYLAVEKGSAYITGENSGGTKSAIVRANGAANPYAMMRYTSGATVQDIVISSTLGMIVTDQIDSKGLIYANDYSANYVDRSLVDKEYVDNVVATGSTGGAFVNNGTNTFTAGTSTFQSVNITGGTFDNLRVTGNTILDEMSATTVSVLNSGATTREYVDYSSNTIESGVTNSSIVAGSGNTIPTGLANVFISGVDITATLDDGAYFTNIFSGTANLSDTFLSTAHTFSGAYLPLSGRAEVTDVFTAQTIYITDGRRIASVGDANYMELSSSSDYIHLETGDGAIVRMTDAVDITGTTSVNDINVLQRDWSFAISDETTAITSGTSKFTAYAPFEMQLQNVYASLNTSGSTSSQFDINVNGTTILSTPITIDANEFHSSDAATPPVITGATISQFDRVSVDIDTAGTNAAGAKIYFVYLRQ